MKMLILFMILGIIIGDIVTLFVLALCNAASSRDKLDDMS